ncbi:MAG: toll/interleukin-1 receptor domain-containing protein [Candidatus Marinimicrobia bacterium]|nr:toll/interleukin-1 receptor domain-containing protein [Candidatus Neomarinimicrobiota bacterium]
MKFEDGWDTVPFLRDRDRELYDLLRDSVTSVEYPGTCVLLHDIQTDTIYLQVKGVNGIIGLVGYNIYERLRSLSVDQVKEDIGRVVELEERANRIVLEYISEYYYNKKTWPLESDVLIKNRELGNINDILVLLITRGYARTWHPGRKDAVCTLTVKGLSLCMVEGARKYTNIYLMVVKSMAEFYIAQSQSDYVTWAQISKKTSIEDGTWDLIYTLLYNEEAVFAQNPEKKSGKIWLDKEILRFEKMQSINTYFWIRHKILTAKHSIIINLDSRVDKKGLSEAASSPDLQYDVFISYSSKDQTVANEIYQLLKENGIKPFLAPKDIDSARKGPQSIKEALRNSQEIAFLMSPNSRNSDWVLTEWGASWVLDKPVTPILLNCEVTDIPELLQEWQKRDYPDELQRYIEEVKKRLNET